MNTNRLLSNDCDYGFVFLVLIMITIMII